jgi:hypothetical protein
VLLIFELAHIGLAYLSAQRASEFASRYAVIGEFNPEFCQFECTRGSEDKDRARLQSIKAAAIQGFSEYSEYSPMSNLTDSKLRIFICSDRENIDYDDKTYACKPHEDPGDPGGLVYINTSYPYTIGSSIGIDLGQIKFRSSTESQIECLKIGCSSSFTVRFTGNTPDWYQIEASASDGRHRYIDCPEGSLIEVESPQIHHDQCTTDGVTFDRFDPSELDLRVVWSGGSISERFKPRYLVRRPNGFRCEPTCLYGEYVIELDE